MGPRSLLRLFACISISFFTMQSNAQDANQNVKEKFTDERGKPSLIVFNEKSTYKHTDFQKVFKEQLGLRDNSGFVKIKSESDRIGYLHEKFQQYHKGIKIEFATYSLHSKAGKLKSMSGEFYQLDNVNTHAVLSKNQAFQSALQQIGATKYLWESPADAKIINYKKPEGELVLLPIVNEDEEEKIREELRLAYKFDIYATNPLSRGNIYIDAVTGNSLFYNAIIKHVGEFGHGNKKVNSATIVNQNSSTAFVIGNAATRYSGNQLIETSPKNASYILSDATRGLGVITYNLQNSTSYNSAVDFVDGDNNWIEYDNSKKDNGALDAHWGAERTYDYWKNVHGRNSFDNAGASIRSYVHYSSNYDNAFWNGSVMTYGDGSGTYFDILTSIDVAGHEIGHAVCSYTADLAYQKESGALNEALSDIWGACIEYYAAPNKQTWLIGEDIERRSGHTALRSMSNPKSEGQPDTYEGIYWVSQKRCRPRSTNDYCGVHTNSGVLNHWFYILTEGKSGTNDIGNSYNVNGIGIDKAAKITYRMENYLSSNSTYANARTYGIQAAKDLFGPNTVEEKAVTDAFYAVGVGSAYSGTVVSQDTTPPSAPANLIASETSDTSTKLTWNASTDNVGVTVYNVYKDGNLFDTATGTTYTVTGLIAETEYTFYVKAKDGAGNLSDASNNETVTTLPAQISSYCLSQGSNANYETIAIVELGPFSNSSTSNSGYEDFTSSVINLTPGSNYTLVITPDWPKRKYKEGYAVWIDFNGDGDFTDSGEEVFTYPVTSSRQVSGTITIPSSLSVSSTRMRVSMMYNGIPGPCDTFAYGQVEDYTVSFNGVSFALTNDSIIERTDFILYPNPTDYIINISPSEGVLEPYKIYNRSGFEVQKGKISEGSINVSQLTKGLYFLELSNNNGTVVKTFIKN